MKGGDKMELNTQDIVIIDRGVEVTDALAANCCSMGAVGQF